MVAPGILNIGNDTSLGRSTAHRWRVQRLCATLNMDDEGDDGMIAKFMAFRARLNNWLIAKLGLG